MAKKKAVRKNLNKKGKIDEKSPPKYKTLEDAYGKNKISDQIKTSKSIVIKNVGIKFSYRKSDFITLKEYRKRKLEKICHIILVMNIMLMLLRN